MTEITHLSSSPAHNPLLLVVRALVLYSLAEHQGGHANSIRVSVSDATFAVEDNGRGHAIARAINGSDYLPIIYTQLQYPFDDAMPAASIQLQGIGMSLINSLCAELKVTVRKREGSLHLRYVEGQLHEEDRSDTPNPSTGTSVSGTIHPVFVPSGNQDLRLSEWLHRVASIHPGLHLTFNDEVVA